MNKSRKKQSPGYDLSKVYSRLRMIANGDDTVNKIRSQLSQTVTFALQDNQLPQAATGIMTAAFGDKLPIQRQVLGDIMEQVVPAQPTKVSKKDMQKDLAKGNIEDEPPVNAFVNVFIELRADISWKAVVQDLQQRFPDEDLIIRDVRIQQSTIQARIALDSLKWLTASPYIHHIESSQSLLIPELTTYQHASTRVATDRKPLASTEIDSSKVIIGIIDVGGFDFAHQDFLTPKGETRFLCIWDQGGSDRGSPRQTFPAQAGQSSEFSELNYGSVILREHMNSALTDAPEIRVPVHRIERQSQQFPSSHATHVASIAAGNKGVCSKADIAAVLIDLPQDDLQRMKTFTDSTRITDAVDFLLAVARKEQKPISINISLGTNGHAHDGSSAVNRWIDAKLSTEGRCLCVATGNAGQEKGLSPDDFGYVIGRIHTSGTIKSSGLMTDLEWHVIGDGITDVSENELEIWYGSQDRFSVMVKPPNGDWIGPVKPQKVVENLQLQDKSFISIYNTLYHRANGDNHIAIYLSPNFNMTRVIGIPSGLWKVRLIGDEIRDGRYNAWIERDDPVRRTRTFWNFPSFFSERTNVDEKSINSLACGQNVIAVGNFDEENDLINITSSQGPTRDNRQKPEIVANGTNVVAANGFSDPQSPWVEMTGTSMASPYVCGIAGLLLSEFPHLTAQQIRGIMVRTIKPIVNDDYTWKNNTGFGLINLEGCLNEAKMVIDKEDITEEFE